MKLQIELLSDLCSHSGDTYNSYIDTDIVYDEYGFPYIPAKRVKGCIREACLELVEFGCVSMKDYECIFGKGGKTASAFTLNNAYPIEHKQMVEDIHKANDPKLTNPQKILRLYTYVRTQTALDLESGTADENSLRTIRVVKKGCKFEAEFEFKDKVTAEQKEIMKNAIRMVKHMGVARTRGLGLVNMKLLDSENGHKIAFDKTPLIKVPSDAETVQLNYCLELNSPVICKSEQGNQAVTQDYIAGSKVLGMFVEAMGQDTYRQLSEKTTFKISNAYIGEDGVRYVPMSKSLQKVKDQTYEEFDNQGRKRLPIKDLLWNYEGKEQLTPVGHGYVSADGLVKEVDTEINYHHRRPEDKSIGRANGKDESSFYQLDSISGGQCFYGFVEADRNMAELLLGLIPGKKNIRLGYGRGTEYGAATFSWVSCKAKQSEETVMSKEFTVKLNSPMILYNSYGCPTASPEVFREYLQKYLGVEKLELKDIYAAYTTIGGFNVTWNARKPIFTALAEGTVCRFSAEENVDIRKIRNAFIGERTREGFGEIELYTNQDVETFIYKDSHPAQISKSDNSEYATDIIFRLSIMQEKQTIAADARRSAKDCVEREKLKGRKDKDAVIGRMILMFRGENSLENLKAQIQGIATDSKRNISLKILEPAETYILSHNGKLTSKDIYQIFISDYLGQIKYMIRDNGKKGETTHAE